MAERGADALEWARQVDVARVSLRDAEDRVRIDLKLEERDSCAQVIAEGVAWLAPLVALATFMTAGTRVGEMEPVPAEVAVPVAGVLFVVGLLGPLLTLLRWRRRGRRRSGLTIGTNAVSFVLGAAGGVAMLLVAGRDGVEPGAWVAAPWTLAALAIIALALQLVASAPAPDPAVQRRIDDDVARRRSEVLAVLHERGAIDEPTRRRADAAPLGSLDAIDRERRAER